MKTISVKFLLKAVSCSLLLLGNLSSPAFAGEKLPLDRELTLISYNIHHGEGLDGVTDYKRIGQLFRKYDADIVALQELDSVTARSGGNDVIRKVAEEALMYPVFARAIPLGDGAYGVGLLSKEHPLSVQRIPLPGREEPRVLLVAEFSDYYIGCTHFSLTQEDRLASLQLIREVASSCKKPFFLAGDWNATPESEELKEVQKVFTLLNDIKVPTYPADKPDVTIDYIAVWKETGQQVVRKNSFVVPESVASDHRPVVVTVRFMLPKEQLLYSAPYLQNPTEDGITVMFQTRAVAHCWVEYGTDTLNLKRARTLYGGQEVCYDIENKIHLSGLIPGKTYYYRVCTQEIGDYRAYSKTFGEIVRTPFYSFRLPESRQQDFTAVVFNDIHLDRSLEQALADAVKEIPYDFVVFNGDCLPEPTDREDAMTHINRLSRLFDGASHPIFFVRGNHEIRNAYSAGMYSLFDYPGGNTYGAFSWGDTRFVILDCGEDKPDDHWVYYGLNDFDGFRREQVDFLKKELKSKIFKKAKRHILINHIPLWGNGSEYNPCLELWSPVLEKAPFDVELCAHMHRFAFYPEKELGNPFPVYVGGAPNKATATIAILQKRGDELKLTVKNLDGKVLKEVSL